MSFCRSQRNQVQSPLLRLPSELRNIIYRYVFQGCSIWVTKNHQDLLYGLRLWCIHDLDIVSLLLTCRQVHAEAAILPYRFLVFEFHGGAAIIEKFLSARSPAQLEAIQTIRVSIEHYSFQSSSATEDYKRFDFVRSLPRLQHITNDLRSYQFCPTKKSLLKDTFEYNQAFKHGVGAVNASIKISLKIHHPDLKTKLGSRTGYMRCD